MNVWIHRINIILFVVCFVGILFVETTQMQILFATSCLMNGMSVIKYEIVAEIEDLINE